MYSYGIEIKAQSSPWKRPEELRPQKAHQVRSNMKVLLTVFCDCNGVVRYEFFLQGCMVNKEYSPVFNSPEIHRIVEQPIMDFAS